MGVDRQILEPFINAIPAIVKKENAAEFSYMMICIVIFVIFLIILIGFVKQLRRKKMISKF